MAFVFNPLSLFSPRPILRHPKCSPCRRPPLILANAAPDTYPIGNNFPPSDQTQDSPSDRFPPPSSSASLTSASITRSQQLPIDEQHQQDSNYCVGDFLYSASLEEHRQQLQAGVIESAMDDPNDDWADAWALSVSPRKAHELRNQYARVAILIESNFADFLPADGCQDAFKNATLDEIAMAKARAVYEVTGLPAIAETSDLAIDAPESGSSINKSMQQGYYTRDVEEQADAMIDRVRPISDENRVTRFKSSVAYYDGEMEIMKNGSVDVAIVFSRQKYATIATTAALDELYKELTRRLGLTFDHFERANNAAEAINQSEKKILVGATLLKERILRDGKMLKEGILKVSSFLNHMVDTDLMEVCGEELAERLRHTMPNKLLTVESTGLIVGLPTARKLGIPLVFARKSRPITISDSYQTTYRSTTKGTTNELIVSCEYLESGDRVLIIDDFLAGGSTAEALFKLAKMAHSQVVGVGVLIEKMSDGGRTFLSGYDVPVESLAKILPGGSEGRINFVEEEPWTNPNLPKEDQKEEFDEAEDSSTEFYPDVVAEAKDTEILDVELNEAVNEVKIAQEAFDGGDEDDGVHMIRWEDEEAFDDLEEDLIRDVRKT